MPKKILTFDCYGTLIDTTPFYNEIKAIGAEQGLDGKQLVELFINYRDKLMFGEPFRLLSEIIHMALKHCQSELKCNILLPEFHRLIHVHQHLPAFEEVKPTLARLKQQGYSLVLLSNAQWSIMDFNLKTLEIPFDHVFLAEDVKCYKPNLQFFNHAASCVLKDANFHAHIAAGFWWDIVPASTLQWNSIWVNRKGFAGLDEYKPYTEITTLDEVLAYL
ncbi:MAG TPA: HAD family hydrolase [Bacteroidales bacterium]|nr:HAD family hydrolase [Bacteroidales bacterium]